MKLKLKLKTIEIPDSLSDITLVNYIQYKNLLKNMDADTSLLNLIANYIFQRKY